MFILSQPSTFTLHCVDFSLFSIFYFLFSFLHAPKKHKSANKRISYFFTLDVFKRIFYFCSLLAFCNFAWLRFCIFDAFCVFGAFGVLCAFCAFGAFDAFGAFGACEIFP